MSARTVKGPYFAIIVDDKRILVKHIYAKGKRCRVIAPEGVLIELCHESERQLMESEFDDAEFMQ